MRRLASIIFALLLGTATACGVAIALVLHASASNIWASMSNAEPSALWRSTPREIYGRPVVFRLITYRRTGLAVTIFSHEHPTDTSSSNDSTARALRAAAWPSDPRRVAPGMLGGDQWAVWPVTTDSMLIRTIGAGWPLICLDHRESQFGLNPSPHTEIRLPNIFGPATPNPPPMHPVWRPLTLNIAFFSLIWFALWQCMAITTRLIRRRKGLCPHCRYDLRHTPPNSPCPECGRP
ncbi:MAG: hypothetical protein K2W85_13190 [Phycisphaerales bacterium]|nr:hypothetical protein [Phycisphaerales bacterium]